MKSLWVAAALLAIPLAANASDLPTAKAPPAPAPAPAPFWTGFYIGGNGGWGWSTGSATFDPTGTTSIADFGPQSLSIGGNGGLWGSQIGYNYQMGGIVAGVEADLDGASIVGQKQELFPSGRQSPNNDGVMTQQTVNWLGSARARLGIPYGAALFYATGGVGWEEVSSNSLISANTGAGVYGDSATDNTSRSRVGYVLGGGAEWMIAPNWALRAEYLYYGFGGRNVNSTAIANNCQTAGTCGVNLGTGSNNISAFRVGLDYKFGDGGLAGGLASFFAPPAFTPNWTGFYVGFNRGWGWSNSTVTEVPTGSTAIADIAPQSLRVSSSGGLLGGQIGYNYQIGGVVAGAEADLDAASIAGEQHTIFLSGRQSPNTDAIMAQQNVEWLGSVRARLGVPYGATLFYATGGVAWEEVATNSLVSANTGLDTFGDSATANSSRTRTGYAVGAGAEWMIAPNWTVRAEYLYYGFSGKNVDATQIANNCQTVGTCGVDIGTGGNSINAIRAGLSYKW
jgi:outer membrane immunogenic protein